MTRARVIIATTYYRPVMGGAESAAARLATFLARRGHEVTVLTKRTSADHPTDETLDGVRVVRLPPLGARTAWGKWRFLPALYRALRRRRLTADVVCCVDYRAIGLAALAARMTTHVPVVFYAQTEGVLAGDRIRSWTSRIGFSPNGSLATILTWPVRRLYRRADALGCISRGIEREAWAAGMDRARVYYVPNPVDTHRLTPPSPAERAALRATLDVPADAVLAVFVGRLSREKGVVELVEAWAAARPAARLAIVGPAMTDHPWDVSVKVHAIARDAGLGDAVRFVGGLPPEDVAQWLWAADFAVQPSHFEAMGLSAAEALAAGLPVIATDTGGYRDFIESGINGLLVPPKDVPALAAAISRLAKDAPLRQRLAQAARPTGERFEETTVLEPFAVVMDRLGDAARSARATT